MDHRSNIGTSIFFAIGSFMIMSAISAAKMIFVSAVYHNMNGDPVKHFNQQLADNLFIGK